jgi:hypothetical protein
MRDAAFRRSQEQGIRLPHIAPLNALVDDLRGKADVDGSRISL